ncbi:hypothetical protein XELAEV_18029176mg [Xenopus laevis]|uniref:Uncharacterized protein n=1 Tax=Xenopus laevis TaxID=8355 RepID=A0A974HHU9_XENLA|nr:hypothetical protein XELAEV_18029176mg [Xenopus laevis]
MQRNHGLNPVTGELTPCYRLEAPFSRAVSVRAQPGQPGAHLNRVKQMIEQRLQAAVRSMWGSTWETREHSKTVNCL